MAEKRQTAAARDERKSGRAYGRGTLGQGKWLNHEQESIQRWLKQVRFKKSLFGGVDEADVWKKIAELNEMYEAALSAERARYDALLTERAGFSRAELYHLFNSSRKEQ